MIYTVTFNPAMDYIVRMDSFSVGTINHAGYERMFAGGKGINVSIVLSELGVKSTALGFVAGFTGREIERQLDEKKICHEFVQLSDGFSRVNVKLKAQEETEINGSGPEIPTEKQQELFERLETLMAGDTLVLAGSVPISLPDDMYERILKRLEGRGIRFVVDASKSLLCNVLKYHPFLIKPNHHELGEIFGKKLTQDEEILACAKKLQEKGAENVLVSMAGDGALLLTTDGRSYRRAAPKGEVKNSVGAGDSMVAGFLAGFMESKGDFEAAFCMGVAAGSASAFSDGLATGEKIESIRKDL